MKKSCVNLVVATVVFIVYLAGCTRNEPPVIDRFVTDPASDTLVTAGDTVKIICEATDPDGDLLAYKFQADSGTFEGPVDANDILWIAPDHSGIFEIICTVSDGDTLHEVADTLVIDVQNYFPMAKGNRWFYESRLFTDTIKLEITVTHSNDLGDGRIEWHIKRDFEASAGNIADDTFSYYTVVGDSVFSHEVLFNLKYLDYLPLLMPLWVTKTWNADEDIATGTVEEKDTVGTDGGIFFNCMRIELRDLDNGEQNRTLWVAPDVGIIKQMVPLSFGSIEFSLVEYEVE